MNQSTGIHCKITCNDQIRRFQFSGTEFCSLHHQVKQLLALDREFVLKYKDNEDDMITISCTEELTCAVDSDVSQKDESGFLRLTVFFPEPSINATEQNQHGPDNCHREHGRDFCHRGYGHGFGLHGHGFGHHEHEHGFGHHGHGFGHHEHGFGHHGHGFGHHGYGFGHHEHGFGHHEHGHGFGHHGHGFGHHEHGHGFGHHGHGFGHHGHGFGHHEHGHGFGHHEHGFGHHEHGHGFGHHGHGRGFCHRGLGLDIEHQEHGHGFGHHEHGHGFGHHGHGFGHHEHGHGFGRHGHGKDFGHREHGCMRARWGGGRWCHEGGPTSSEYPCNKNRFERCRDKLTLKRDLFKAYLNSLEARELTPEEERRKLMFLERVQRLELILTKFPPKDEANVCPEKEKPEICPLKDKCYHKFEKKARKRVHKEGKRREAKNSYLSEEAKAEISTLKSKIRELKPTLWDLQDQLKVKKSALRAASDAGQQAKISELKNEIEKLKQEKWDKKGQIKPLCQRLHQLKSGK